MKAAAPAPTRHRLWVLGVLCSLAFLTYLDRICIMRMQGDIERDLRLGELTASDELVLRERGLAADPAARTRLEKDRATVRMGWIFSAFVAGYFLFEVPGGWMGDRWGPRRVIFRIVLWWSLFTALTGGVKPLTRLFTATPGPAEWLLVLIIIRFLFGAGEAGAYPNIARALGTWFPFRERATAQSFIWFSSRLGGALAPAIIGGLLLVAGGWERAFGLLGLAGAVWAVGFRLWFRDRPADDLRVNAAERARIESDAASPGEPDAGQPMRWSALFSANVLALCLASFCVSFCFYFYITFLPKYLKDQFQIDYSQSQFLSGLPLLLGGGACLVGGFLSDHAIRRTGSRRWGRSLVPIVGWTGAGLCALAVPQLDSALAVVGLLAVGFACQDLGVPSMWSLPADIGGRFAGTLGGWMNSAGAIGGMLSPLVAARISIAHGWNATFLVFAAVYFVGAMAWLRVDASRPMVQSNNR